jgi:hypothetical protein
VDTIYKKLFLHQTVRGFAALIVVMTFLSGTVLFFLGIVGEYIGRIYEEIKARPIYVVDRCIGHAFIERGGANRETAQELPRTGAGAWKNS